MLVDNLCGMPEFIYVMSRARKAHGDKVILDDVTLSFLPGAKIGVVGPNGAGKSTVLKIMAGLDQPSNGEARLTPGYTVGILMQEPELNEAKTVLGNVEEGVGEIKAKVDRYNEISALMAEPDADFDALMTEMGHLQEAIDAADAWDLDSQLEQAMDALRCPPPDADVTVLSGGERRRVALCKLLLQKPDLLLLDEPTNHLDAESVLWLEQHLAAYHGAVVAVTHDRYFLDNVAEWILELDRGRAYPYEGNYSTYLEKKDERLEVAGKKDAKLAKRLAEELEWVRSNAKGRQTKCKARLARYEEMAAEAERTRKLDFEEIQIPPGPRLGSMVIEAKNLHKGFGDRVLIDGLSFTLPRNGIVGVIGPNGVGKTTLFKTIVGLEQLDGGEVKIGETVKISYVDQSRGGIDPNKNLWETVSDGLDYIKVGKIEIPSRAYVASSASRAPTSRRRPACSPVVSATGSTWRSRSSRAATCCCSTSRPTTSTSRRSAPSRTPCSSSPAAPWSSATTGGSSTGSRRTSWPTRAPTRTRPSGTGSRATSSRTRRTRSSGSAWRRPARTGSPTASSPATDERARSSPCPSVRAAAPPMAVDARTSTSGR